MKNKMKMSSIFLFAIVFALSPLIVIAETVGSMTTDNRYTAVEGLKNLDGRMHLLIFGTTKQTGPSSISEIISAPTFEVHLNQHKIATIKQSFTALATQKGEFKFLQIDLPNGRYTAEIFQSTVFNSGLVKKFEFIVQKGYVLPVVVENLQILHYDSIPRKVGGLSTVQSNELDEESYQILRRSMVSQAEAFYEQVSKLRAETQIAKEEAARKFDLALELEKKRIAEQEQQAELLRAKRQLEYKEKEKREKAQAIAKQKEERDLINKEDDAMCRSFGAKFGTEPYVSCRVALSKARAEQIDREQSNRVTQENLYRLQQQLNQQRIDSEIALQKKEDERRREDALNNQRLADERRRRERLERLDAAQRALEMAGRLSQPTPGVAVPMPQFPQRTRCFQNDNFFDCTTQ